MQCDCGFRQTSLKPGETAEKRLELKSNRNQTIDHKFRQHVPKLLSRRLAPMALHVEAFLSRSSP
jgi:hypothetical protein